MKYLLVVVFALTLASKALGQGVPERLLKMGTYMATFESLKDEKKILTLYFSVAKYKKFAILRELQVDGIRYISLTTGRYKYDDGGLLLKIKDLKAHRAKGSGTEVYSSCMDPAETAIWNPIGNRVDIEKNRDGTTLKGGPLFAYLFGKREVKFVPAPPEAAYVITLETVDDIDGEGLNIRPVCFKPGMKGISG